MSTGRWPWDALGIAPSDDARAVRRAYAAVLKAGDYDTDADGFAALRDARDAALREVEHGPPELVEGASSDAPGEEGAAVSPQPGGDEPALLDTDAPWHSPPAAESDFDRHARQLEQALFAEREMLPDDAEVAAMRADLDALLTDPRMDDVTTYAQVEEGIAHVLASTIPISDPLIDRATDFFGWDRHEDDIHALPAVAWLMQHRRVLGLRAAVSRPEHRLHRAWRELTTPAVEGSRRGWFVGRKKVAELLALIRRDCPALEGELDSWRVAMWERKGSFIVEPWAWALILFACLQLARFCMDVSNPMPRPGPMLVADVLTDAPADIDAALRFAVQNTLTGARLRATNPALARALQERWTSAKAKGEARSAFLAATTQFLLDEAAGHFDEADYDLLVEWRRWQVEAARTGKQDQSCLDVFRRLEPPPGPRHDLLVARRHVLFSRALEKVDGVPDPPQGDRKFNIPGQIVERTRALSGLSLDRLRASFTLKGTPAEQCRSTIALIEATLEAPRKQALPLLRAL